MFGDREKWLPSPALRGRSPLLLHATADLIDILGDVLNGADPHSPHPTRRHLISHHDIDTTPDPALADWLGVDPADIDRPHVELCLATVSGIPLYLNLGQVRALAAALLRAADAADTEAFYRPPGVAWTVAISSVPSGQA